LKDNEKIVNRETLPLKLSEKTTKSLNGDEIVLNFICKSEEMKS
jgi:hypothetical protein